MRDSTRPRPTALTSLTAIALAVSLPLVAACEDTTPMSPSEMPSAAIPSASAVANPVTLIGAFATAPDTATLKVTAPVPQAPVGDVVVEGQQVMLTFANLMGRFVEAPDLRLGVAIWQVGSNNGLTLIEAVDVPLAADTTSYTVETVLNHDTQYRWRGRGVFDGAFGPWSAWASFRTAPPPSDPTARYVATFEAAWSAATHPEDFPGNPHFSPLIGATHLAATRFWEAGALASEGIERMAELGSQSPLDAEIVDAQAAGIAETLIRGGGLSVSPGTRTVEFDVTTAFPYVTLVTMVAPSPDWFVGVSALPLLANGEWRTEVVVELSPWDAGTDSGASYESGNADMVPPASIALLRTAPVVVNGSVPAFGRFIFRRLQ